MVKACVRASMIGNLFPVSYVQLFRQCFQAFNATLAKLDFSDGRPAGRLLLTFLPYAGWDPGGHGKVTEKNWRPNSGISG